jgi:transcriptional regulator with XRE-family HTH domain
MGGIMFDKIVKLCEENNISVLVLEEKLGFGKCTISKWKKSSPTVNKLKKVADYFGVSVDYFLDDDMGIV